MKLFLSIFLSVLLISPIVIKVTIMSWWDNNHEMIVAEQCENRFNTTVMCSGRCVLEKEIGKYDQHDQESAKGQLSNIMKMGIDVFEANAHSNLFSLFTKENTIISPVFIQKYLNSSVSGSLIKPPIV